MRTIERCSRMLALTVPVALIYGPELLALTEPAKALGTVVLTMVFLAFDEVRRRRRCRVESQIEREHQAARDAAAAQALAILEARQREVGASD